jgi:predicted DNA-binding transcriptional regulator AlpA
MGTKGGQSVSTTEASASLEAASKRPMTVPAQRTHLTIADVCAELGVARSTFYDWRAARKAPKCIKLPNGDIRIRRADFERWLEGLEDPAR